MSRLIHSLLVINTVVWFGQVASAQTITPASQKTTRVREFDRPAKTMKEWMAQSEAPPTSTIVQVTSVKVDRTESGLNLVLETAEGKPLQVDASKFTTQGNAFVAEITNAVLTLPDGKPFQVSNPTPDIISITAEQVTVNSIRIRVVGDKAPPKTEVTLKTGVLAYSLNPDADTSDEEIVVTGAGQRGYRVPNTSVGTRTDTPLRDIPQSIQVIPRQVIEDQGITKIIDATRNVSGVSPLAGYGGIFYDYTIRGFSSYNVLRNGFKTSNIFSYGANIERVEVLKGPASVLYGQFEPGGVVNYVTKQPLSNPSYTAEFTAGSFSFYRGAIDLSAPLTTDKKLLYRLNVAYENSGNFRDFNDYDIFSIAPVITYKPSENTTLNFAYEYGRRRGGFDRGFPPTDPVFLTLPVSRNLGEPNLEFLDVDYHRGTLTLDHRFSDSLQLRSGLSVQSVFERNAYVNIAGGTFDSQGRLERYYSNDIGSGGRRTEDYSWQTDLIAKFNTGSIAHQLLLGLELSRFTDVYASIDGDITSLDIFNPVYGARPTNLRFSYLENTRSSTTGIYLQDQVTLLSNLKLLVGGRYDFVDYDSLNGRGTPTKFEFDDTAFSPRVGLVYQPIEPISLYASYSRSFVPNNARTASGEPLQPSRGTQYEVGVKAELFDKRLSATLAAYDITKTNVPTVDPDNTDFSIAVGEVKSRGIELDVAGEILPGWKIIASGYVNDAFVSKDNSIPEGRRLENTAYHGVSLWTTYEIQKGDLQGLQFGAGIFFVGDRIANQGDPLTLPSYVRTDAAISYKRDRWRVALNFKNIFGVKYYDTNGYLVFPQAPFTIQSTVSVNF